MEYDLHRDCCDICGEKKSHNEIFYEYSIDTYMCAECYYDHPMNSQPKAEELEK